MGTPEEQQRMWEMAKAQLEQIKRERAERAVSLPKPGWPSYPLKVGDVFTIAGTYLVNPEPFSLTREDVWFLQAIGVKPE